MADAYDENRAYLLTLGSADVSVAIAVDVGTEHPHSLAFRTSEKDAQKAWDDMWAQVGSMRERVAAHKRAYPDEPWASPHPFDDERERPM